MKRPKIYLCARVAEDAQLVNNRIASLLSPYFDVFVPHQKEAELKQPKDPVEIYNLDLDAMKAADICFTIAPYGRDCAWEMGHFIGEGKPVFVYTPDYSECPRDDWMVSAATTAIFSDNVEAIHSYQKIFDFVAIYTPLDHLGSVVYKYYQNGGR